MSGGELCDQIDNVAHPLEDFSLPGGVDRPAMVLSRFHRSCCIFAGRVANPLAAS